MGCKYTSPMLEHKDELSLLGPNLVDNFLTSGGPGKVKSGLNNIKTQITKNLKNITEKNITSDEFLQSLPQDIYDYITKHPYMTSPEDEEEQDVIDTEPVVLNGGNSYWGQWNGNTVMSGKGKYFIQDEGVYVEGVWKDGIFTKGRIIIPEGVYEGEILDNTFNGQGTMRYKDGRVYEGNWVKNNKEGEGCLSWPDGSKYWGHFENDQINGEGEFIWTNGYHYKGNFVDGVFEGKGMLKAKNGSKYEGEFKEGLYDGYGKFTWGGDKDKGSKVKYVGCYKYGNKEGSGKYYMKNGHVFDGMWKDGLPHGQGVVETEYKTYKSMWRNGQMVENVLEEVKEDDGVDENVELNFDFKNVKKEDIDYKMLVYLDIIPGELREEMMGSKLRANDGEVKDSLY